MLRSLLGRAKTVILRFFRRYRRFYEDPPLDVITAAMFGFLIGRIAAYALIAALLLAGGQLLATALLLLVVYWDASIHSIGVRQMIRLIRYELLSTPAQFMVVN